MAIKYVAIHIIKRMESSEDLFVKLRDTVNPLSGLSRNLADQLLNLFGEANLQKGEFGVNGDNTVQPILEQQLNRFYSDNLDITDFIGLTRALATNYQSIISGNNAIKGGYLVCYQYTKNDNEWLGIAVVPRTDGFDITDNDAEVVLSNLLELNKLHLGAAINLSKWKLGIDSRYISFKTGQAKQIRDYFETFIGCQRDKQAIKIETRNLREAVRKEAKRIGLNDIQVQERVDQTHALIQRKIKEKSPVLLSTIANAIFPDDPQSFITKASDDFDLGEELTIDNGELKRFVKLSGTSKNINLSFDRKMLGDSVLFEPANPSDEDSKDEIRITAIPESLKQAILEELAFRAAEETEHE